MSGPEERPGVWVSDHLGTVVGDGNYVHNHFHQAEPSVPWPVVTGRISPPNPAFVERPILTGDGGGSRVALAATGDGGVGKPRSRQHGSGPA